MQLTIQNKHIATLFEALSKMKIGNMRANRGRVKFLSRLGEKYQEYASDELDLVKEYVEVDEAGSPIVYEDKNYKLKDPSQTAELQELVNELANETVVIKGGEYTNRYKDFLDYLLESDEEFSVEEMTAIDSLLEQYEALKEV